MTPTALLLFGRLFGSAMSQHRFELNQIDEADKISPLEKIGSRLRDARTHRPLAQLAAGDRTDLRKRLSRKFIPRLVPCVGWERPQCGTLLATTKKRSGR